MKKLLAIGLVSATCLPIGIAAEEPGDSSQSLGTVNVLVIEDSAPAADVACARSAIDKAGSQCAAVHRAVLSARIQKVSALHERGRWL
jgi:hypothetical protein